MPEQIYNDPINGSPSSVGPQARTDYYHKKALIDAAKETYFGQHADTMNMPKNMGKKIKRYHYLPILDDANINDQGIDAGGFIANGTNGIYKFTIVLSSPDVTTTGNGYVDRYFIGEDVLAANAIINAKAAAEAFFFADPIAGGLGLTGVYAADVITIIAAGWKVQDDSPVDVDHPVQQVAVPNTGNLYGSSYDVGTITGKLPLLSETGGRVNRVGFKRIELTGNLEKFGFFDEYTQESMDFDTDAELEMHMRREMIMAANEINEDLIQKDLLNSAGVVRFTGIATQTSEITGEVDISEVTYDDLLLLSIDLDNNRTPKHTKLISGSRMIDTKVIDAARYMACGSEMLPTLKSMKDPFGNQAWIPVQHYASAGNVAVGEAGTIDQFRFIIVPEMMRFEGAGAAVTANEGYYETNGNYDVFPMLVIGEESFTTIGFQTDGKGVKFKIKHVKPESDISYGKDDPFGELGFISIKWYYGFMPLRPERLALIKTAARFAPSTPTP